MAQTTNPHVCARCVQVQAGCCVLQPGEEQLLFPLFPVEVQRISKYVGHEDWAAAEPNVDNFTAVMKRMFPLDVPAVSEIFVSTENHQRLGVTEAGVCVFIGEKGCTLPQDIRPYHCRLFPVWMRGKRIMMLEADCLARKEANTLDELLDSIGSDRAAIREVFRKLRQAWGLPPI